MTPALSLRLNAVGLLAYESPDTLRLGAALTFTRVSAGEPAPVS